MIRISMFKTPKPKQFGFKPRYYDAEKDKKEQRLRRIRAELGKDVEPTNSQGYDLHAAKERISAKWGENRREHNKMRSNAIVIVFAGLLFIISYYIFYT